MQFIQLESQAFSILQGFKWRLIDMVRWNRSKKTAVNREVSFPNLSFFLSSSSDRCAAYAGIRFIYYCFPVVFCYLVNFEEAAASFEIPFVKLGERLNTTERLDRFS